jgi:hypothetical protein
MFIAQILEVTDGDAAAVIRDTLYIDGGYLWWEPGMADGTFGALINDGNSYQEKPRIRDQCLFAQRKPGGTSIPFEFQHSVQHVGILQFDECLHNEIKGCWWK